MTTFMTIERHILEQQQQFEDATGTLTQILYDMALAGKVIARETNRSGLVSEIIGGTTGGTNPTGDLQNKLDVYANDIIFKMNDHTGRLCVMASEEHEGVLPIPPQFECGNYVLVFDPLDGSGNIGVNVGVGTIFSIFRRITDTDRGTLEDCLQPGRDLVAAGYLVYGPSTMMVYTTGQGVHGFTLDPGVGEFFLSHPNIMFPEKPQYYSANLGYYRHWTQGIRHYTDWLSGTDDDPGVSLSLRYAGSLVTDFHRNLLRGGVYYYPGDLRDPKKPSGKLRLLYENAPLAFIAEQAGGYASDGCGNILDITPNELHQRTPLFIGNKTLVKKAEALVQEYDADWVNIYLQKRDGN